MNKGLFVVFEGIDGCGKTTQIDLLRHRLKDDANEPICFTREPGGTGIGQNIRETVLNRANRMLDPYAELLLYCADRAQHVAQVIRPALEQGGMVICDRYIYSTVAYQGYGRKLNISAIEAMNEVATQGLKPDIVFWLDLRPDLAMQRLQNQDRMESQGLAFFERVAYGFGDQFLGHPEVNAIRIDATQSAKDISDQIYSIIKTKLSELAS